MANSRRVRGITVEIGGITTPLENALSVVNTSITQTSDQLRDVNRLLRLDPENTQLLAQQQRLLAQSIERTSAKLEELQTAESQVQAQFARGDISQAQYEALQREIIDTRLDLERLESQSERTERSLGDMARNSARSLSTATGQVSSALAPVSRGAGLVAVAFSALGPATEEYRNDMSKLEQNTTEAGMAFDFTTDIMKDMTVVTREMDSSIEATSNLIQAGFTEENKMVQAMEAIIGASIRFPDTVKIESLADSLQETLATGTPMGQFAEVLDRVGYSSDRFAQQMSECSTAAEKQQLVLDILAKEGLNDTYLAYKENNQVMLDNAEATFDLKEQVADLAEASLPLMTLLIQKLIPLISMLTDALVKILTWFDNLDPSIQNFILGLVAFIAIASPVLGAISAISSGIVFLMSPIGLVTAAIVLLIAIIATIVIAADDLQSELQDFDNWMQEVFATDWSETLGVMGESLNNFANNVKGVWDGIKLVLTGMIDFISGVFTGDWERAWNGVLSILAGIGEMTVAIVKAPFNTVISMINMIVEGTNNMMEGMNRFMGSISGGNLSFDVGSIPKIPLLAKGGVLRQGTAIVGEAGAEKLQIQNGKAIVTPLSGYGHGTSSTTSHADQFYFTIQADSITEFNDLVEMAKNAQRDCRVR